MKALTTVFLAVAMLAGCAAMIPNKPVSMVGEDGAQYSGEIDYADGYSGTLTIPSGPNGESFSGKFVVVDSTSTSMKNGALIIPSGNGTIPAVGGIAGSSSGQVMATGYWHGIGSSGTQLAGEMNVGRGGHGHGVCKDSEGRTYRIMF